MAIAYMQTGQLFQMDGVVHELDRLIGSEWQHYEVKTKRAHQIAVGTFQQKYALGEIRFINPVSNYIPNSLRHVVNGRIAAHLEFYSETQQELMKIRRLLLESILKRFGDNRSQTVLKQAIIECWNLDWGKAPSTSTVAKLLKRYIESDKDIRSLCPCDFLKGNRQNRYPHQVKEFCLEAINHVYLQRNKGSVKKTYEAAKKLIYDENTLRIKDYQLPYPDISYIRSLIGGFDAFMVHTKRYGQNAAERKFRNAVHTIICNKPLERVEIDHTQLDAVIVDAFTGLPIGRPWITVAIDVY